MIPGCEPYSQKACEDVAEKLGKELGRKERNQPFLCSDCTTWADRAGCFGIKGTNSLFYGTGGTTEQMKMELGLSDQDKAYRPPGYDCKGNVVYTPYI